MTTCGRNDRPWVHQDNRLMKPESEYGRTRNAGWRRGDRHCSHNGSSIQRACCVERSAMTRYFGSIGLTPVNPKPKGVKADQTVGKTTRCVG
jgi:hypothetical protein